MRLIFWSILLFAMWLILSGNFQVANVAVGVIVSISLALFYIKLFKHKKFEFINPFWFAIYILVLAKNIIISNFEIAKRTLSKDMKLSPAIVAVKTDLKSDWKKLLLANSVTLTPGTLTLDVKDDILYIHIIECKNISQKEKITQEFERVIAKI